MTTVTIPVSLGGTGTPYTDGTGLYGMASKRGYGYNTYLMPMLSEVMAACAVVITNATNSAASATAAASSASAAAASAAEAAGYASLGGLLTGEGGTTVSLVQGKLKFPATQSPSADANTLDDYEEGTFTPGVLFGGAAVGVTYNDQNGTYVKVGRAVHFRIYIVLASKGSSVGELSVTGLPFTNGGGFTACAIWVSSMTGISDAVAAFVQAGATTIAMRQLIAGTAESIVHTNVLDTGSILLAGTYFV